MLAKAIDDEDLAVLEVPGRVAKQILILFLKLNFDAVTCYAGFKCFSYC